jgi:serine/threonine-protein kinase HipA
MSAARNHGFLYVELGRRLAPAYDLNPVPIEIKSSVLTTAIDEDDGTASAELAVETAAHYGLKPTQARIIMREVGAAVSRWRKIASDMGLSKKEIERMSSAFDHEDLARASSGSS